MKKLTIFLCSCLLSIFVSKPALICDSDMFIEPRAINSFKLIVIRDEPTTYKKKRSHVEKPVYTKEEIDLIALVTMAEAEGESEYGKRLVIDTILNRVDSKYFPNTVKDVIYQPHQFTSMWNGRVNRCYVDKNIRRLVVEEIKCRTTYLPVFFTAGRYSKYGTPLLQEGNHYFSKY